MNRSLSGAIRASMLVPAAAAVALSTGALAPVHATVGPVKSLTENAVRGTVPTVAGATSSVLPGTSTGPLQRTTTRPRPQPAAAGDTEAVTALGRDALATATRQLGATGLVPECTFIAEGAVDGVSTPLDRKRGKAKKRAAAGKCGSVQSNRRLHATGGDALGGLTGAVQPGLPLVGSLGSPQIGAPGLRQEQALPAEAGRALQAPYPAPADPAAAAATVLPIVMPGGIGGLFGGLPGAGNGLPRDYAPGPALTGR